MLTPIMLLPKLVALADRGRARCVLRHYETGCVAEQKADNSPVTAADREAEALIEARL